jgi:branched-chain amino acid transport system permease protein
VKRFGVAALLLVWLCLPLLPVVPNFWLTLADYAGIASIVAIGIVVLTGMAGITSFGQATFMGFGAYTTALLTTQAGWSPWLSLPMAMLASGLMSLVIGAVTLRLSGHYLALGTIAWSVAFFYVFGNLDILGRNDGISGIPPLQIGGTALLDSRSYFPVVWISVAVSLLLTRNLLDSRIGRAIRALRGGAAAAASFGVRLAGLRMLAFAYAAVLAGLAGWLYAHMQRSVSPTPFGINAGIEYLLMAVVGGVGNLAGAILGAGLVTIVNDRLQDILPRLLGSQGNYETIVFGALLVLTLQTAPAGLWNILQSRRGWRTVCHRHDGLPLTVRTPVPSGTCLIQADRLRKTFGGLVAVSDLSFTIVSGEIVGIIGPNGAGKSTTFDLLSGVTQPTSGTVRFLDKTILGLTGPAIASLGVARSFQHVKLVPSMSLLENVAIGAHLRGSAGPLKALLRLDRAEEAKLFAEAHRQLGRVGLASKASQPASSLALGQQRIAEIARALCLDPILLLLDEPAAGLRHAEKIELASLLQVLKSQGVTILLVEHDMAFVMGLTDRLVVMNFGSKLAEGPTVSVGRDPAVIEAYLGTAA